MSILWTLRKWVDPIEHGLEEEARRRQRETLPAEPQPGDGPEERPAAPRTAPEATFRCRVCGLTARDEAFCPRFLAGTMQPLRRR
ncbi:MAG TPA: hypothetical protein VK447_11760 [Myxococcaceae bacterium]|nr:hypothetical protein [Myxococcaceae bacterium]